jgi:hypothetical protein
VAPLGPPGQGRNENSGTKWHRDGANLFPSFLKFFMYLNSYTSLYVICSLHVCYDAYLVGIFVVCSWHFWSEYGPSAPCMSDKNVRHLLLGLMGIIRSLHDLSVFMCVICYISACLISMCNVHAWSKRVSSAPCIYACLLRACVISM